MAGPYFYTGNDLDVLVSFVGVTAVDRYGTLSISVDHKDYDTLQYLNPVRFGFYKKGEYKFGIVNEQLGYHLNRLFPFKKAEHETDFDHSHYYKNNANYKFGYQIQAVKILV